MSSSAPTSPTARDGKRMSLAKAGPYASSLLIRERAVLLEWEVVPGTRTRQNGRLTGGTRAGGTLRVHLSDPAAADVPAPGTPVILVVPAHSALWRFVTVARDGASGEGDGGAGVVALDWPAEVVQETGRRFARALRMLPVRLAVGSQQPDQRGAGVLATYTLDISIGGAQLAVPRPMPIGTPVRLEIRLPQDTFTAEAVVAWTRMLHDEPGDPMHGVGVRFTAVPPRGAARLRALLGMSGIV